MLSQIHVLKSGGEDSERCFLKQDWKDDGDDQEDDQEKDDEDGCVIVDDDDEDDKDAKYGVEMQM